MITRKDYINSPSCKLTHRRFYAQFVTPEIRQAVQESFGAEALIEEHSKCPHFNSIPIQYWDALAIIEKESVDHDLLREAGESWSQCTGLCILKEAARQIVESVLN